jgi:hypothetical protein
MIKLFDKINENGISPNGLYLLYCIKNKKKPININETYEMRFLIIDNFLDDDFAITQKGQNILEKIEASYEIKDDSTIKKKLGLTKKDQEYIKIYREMFPKGNLPSGSPARISITELEKKFLWFLNNYKYTWDVILKATKKYIEQYEQEGYKYMKTSGYFIVKNGLDRTSSSVLANYCDMVLDGDIDLPTGPLYSGAI